MKALLIAWRRGNTKGDHPKRERAMRLFHLRYFALLLWACLPATACAHAVGVDCALRGDKVEVEGFYDDDSPAQKAKVRVVNAKGELIADGVTDEKGRWSFRTPAPGKYQVELDAGAGHRVKKTIEVPIAKVDEAAPTSTITEGPIRAEFTRLPWEKALIGLAAIVGLSGAFLLTSMVRKNAKRG